MRGDNVVLFVRILFYVAFSLFVHLCSAWSYASVLIGGRAADSKSAVEDLQSIGKFRSLGQCGHARIVRKQVLAQHVLDGFYTLSVNLIMLLAGVGNHGVELELGRE